MLERREERKEEREEEEDNRKGRRRKKKGRKDRVRIPHANLTSLAMLDPTHPAPTMTTSYAPSSSDPATCLVLDLGQTVLLGHDTQVLEESPSVMLNLVVQSSMSVHSPPT